MQRSQPLKICEISSMHPWADDRVFERACTGFAREGHDVTYIVTHKGSPKINGVKFKGIKPRTGISRRLISSFEATIMALKTDADVYHFHDPDLLPFILILKLFGKKVIYDIHENYIVRFQQWGMPWLTIKVLTFLFRALENNVIRFLDGIIVTTQTMGDMFQRYARQTLVVRNVVDVDRLKGVNLDEPKYPYPDLLISGTNSPARNCREAVMALKFLKDKAPEAKLRFVGNYDPEGYAEDLKTLAKEIGVEENLILEGMVPWGKNFERVARSRIGCVFYEHNDNNQVTTPNRLYEYMFCGIPILAEDFPELRKVVEEIDCGVLVNSSSPESIAEGAMKLLNDPERAKQMGQNGRKAVLEKYNFQHEMDAMIDMFSKLSGK